MIISMKEVVSVRVSITRKSLKNINAEDDLKDCVRHAISNIPDNCTDDCRFVAQRILDEFEVKARYDY